MSPADEPIPDWAIPAATLIVMRNGHPAPEILMVVRSKAMRFVGGMAVFPGGRVEEQDYTLADTVSDIYDYPRECIVSRIAAIRETLEETGLLVGVRGELSAPAIATAREQMCAGREFGEVLSENGWHLDLDQLHWMARWRPPIRDISHLFDTRFYIATVGTGAIALEADGSESRDVFWATAKQVLADGEAGKLALIGPTRANLLRLAQSDTFETAKAQIAEFPPRYVLPHVDLSGDRPWVGVPEGHGYPEVRFIKDGGGVVEALEKNNDP